METDSAMMETSSTKEEGARRLLNSIFAFALTLVALMLIPTAGSVKEPYLGEFPDIASHFGWLFRIWSPFVLAVWSLFVSRSTWRRGGRDKTSSFLLVLSFVLDATLIFLYAVFPFLTVLFITLLG